MAWSIANSFAKAGSNRGLPILVKIFALWTSDLVRGFSLVRIRQFQQGESDFLFRIIIGYLWKLWDMAAS